MAPAIVLQIAVSLALVSVGIEGAIAQTAPLSNPSSTAPVSAAAMQRIVYVNPATGNDQADGSEVLPFRTITRALQSAQPQTIILLAAGTYSTETGEIFPLVMKPEVTIQGDPTTSGQDFVIQGGGLFLSPTSAGQNIALLGANQAVLAGVTLTNPNPRGYGLWTESSSPIVLGNTFTGSTHDGISTVGSSAPLIQGNVFVRNGANGITIFGNSRPQVRQNVFEQTGFGINISDQAAPLIQDNRVSQNRIGILVQKNAQPVIRGNLIEESREDGIAAIARSLPNLGTASEPGNNTFRNNDRHDINASANQQIISAVGNPTLSDRVTGRIDTVGVLSASNSVMVASVAEQIPLGSTPAAAVLINQLPPVALSSAVPSGFSSTPQATVALARHSAPQFPIPQPLASQPLALQTASAIDIPVPRPAQPRSLPQSPSLPAPATPILQADLLPVPSEQVPIGNIGDLPTVNVPSGSSRGAEQTAFTRPSADLKYRVLVEASSDRLQKLVQSVVPGAFLVREQGRSLMQIGAFSSRDNAESAVQMLNQNGLRAVIEDFE
jgi:parallel beta-helix repeat protein